MSNNNEPILSFDDIFDEEMTSKTTVNSFKNEQLSANELAEKMIEEKLKNLPPELRKAVENAMLGKTDSAKENTQSTIFSHQFNENDALAKEDKSILEQPKADLSSQSQQGVEESNSGTSFEKALNKLPSSIRDLFKEQLKKAINYTPKIGIMGKSGAGKSSLANAIVGRKAFQTGGVGGCTRSFQEEVVEISANRKMIFMDLPGIGESQERREEYETLYKEKMPELDIIIWAIKVDDRANEIDGRFYRWLTQFYKKEQILFVLTQADKAEPSFGWINTDTHFGPSSQQASIIEQNRQRISQDFDVSIADVIAVASHYYSDEDKFRNYNFEALIPSIMNKVPKEAKSGLYASVDKDDLSAEAKKQIKEEAKSGFGDVLNDIVDSVIDLAPVSEPIRYFAKKGKKVLVELGKSIWNRVFG